MKKILAIVLTLVMLLSCVAFAEEVKPVILVVSFGTSYNDNRDLSIGGVEEAIQAAYIEPLLTYCCQQGFNIQS